MTDTPAQPTTTATPARPGGTWTLGDMTVARVGYGAMQLAGPAVMGPPADPDNARAVLREAVALGINHVDTSDAYGPRITNALIRDALYPYDSLLIATKVGARRSTDGGWPPSRRPDDLRRQVAENLESLGVDALDLVNLRMGDATGTQPESLAEPLRTLAALRDEGVIRHLGLSSVTAEQVTEAGDIAPIVCVQNMYNVAYRADDELIDRLAADGIAYVPFFPLGGFTPLQSATLSAVAERHATRPAAVALAWLLQRSPNILLIPGTSRIAHLHDNVAAAALSLTDADLAALDTIAAA